MLIAQHVCLGALGISIIPGGNERDERLKYLKREHIADYHKEDDDDLDSCSMFDQQQSLSGGKSWSKKQIYGDSRCHFIHNLQHHQEG